MATQVTNVYIKKKNDTEWTELEKVYNGDELIFQKSPTGYNYDQITLSIAPSGVENIWYITNNSPYTVNVGWTNGVIATYVPNTLYPFPVGINPIWVQVGSLPAANLGALNLYTYIANCPVSYIYLRNLFVK